MTRRSHCIGAYLLLLGIVPAVQAQFVSYSAFRDSLTALTQITDATERADRLTVFWDTLRARDQVPFTHGQQAAFLYKGSAASIQFPGDHNGWSPSAAAAVRLAPSDVWIHEESFPEDARLDYKIVVNGSQWILDPVNPRKQRGGFGDNSELRMPAYVPSPWVVRDTGTPQGNYSSVQSIASPSLGYAVNYRVYTPPGYDDLSDLPVIYVTDGHEYAHDLMGSMRIVLDNLIEARRIVPVIAVFIDPRVGGNNLRAEQYVLNPRFADFVADELVPAVDAAYRSDQRRYARGILGTSLGGLNAAYFAAQRTDTFYLIGIQSPAFAFGSSIYGRFEQEPTRDVRIHMSWGAIRDVGDAGERMATILANKGFDFETLVLNEGHSWGAWRATLDDVLEYFWGPLSNVAVEDEAIPGSATLGINYPNPFRTATTIPFRLSEASTVRLTVFDVLGRQIAVLVAGPRPAGEHAAEWRAPPGSVGVYLYRLEAAGRTVATGTMLRLR